MQKMNALACASHSLVHRRKTQDRCCSQSRQIARQDARFCRLTNLSMGPCRKVHPDVVNSRASFVRARTRCTEKRTTIEQPGHDGESRSGKKPRTQRHAPALRCRRRIVPKRSLRPTGKEGKREEGVGIKNPSQHEVVRDGRRVTDGIRTHDIQNHNLTL